MSDFYFLPGMQPELDSILTNLNVKRIDPVVKRLISGATIQADEIYTNVNPLIGFISLGTSFFNNEGANRILNLQLSGGLTVFVSGNVTTGSHYLTIATYNTPLYFNNISFSVAPVNATTLFTFLGYKVTLES